MDAIDKQFLGREFLTWLVYYIDQHEGQFEGFSIRVGERVALRSLMAEIGEMKVKGESPADAADLRYAIAGGLTIREAELIVVKGKRTFKAILVADSFDLKSVKLPVELDEKPREDVRLVEVMVEERLMLLQELDSCIALAFKAFLDQRIPDEHWNEFVVPSIRNWLIESLTE